MRIVIQRVNFAELKVDTKLVSKIDTGLVVLLGVEPEDTHADIEWICKKLTQLRIFSDESSKMNKSLIDVQGEVLVVSQFTLHASTKKGNRPSFIKSAKPEYAESMYNDTIKYLEGILDTDRVKTGVFGANMQILLENNGPVTITIDSKNRE